jgi:spermidine/putrescine transport system permease protein
MQGEGVVNTFLGSFGIDKIKMLYTNGAVQLGTIYTLLPLMILPIYNSVEKIDKSLVEAARDLGADGWTVFRTVIWKLSLPGVMSGCLMVFVPSIGFFYISDMLGGSNIMLLGNLIKNQFLEARDWPFGAALSVVMAFLAILLIGIYKKFTNGKKVDLLL